MLIVVYLIGIVGIFTWLNSNGKMPDKNQMLQIFAWPVVLFFWGIAKVSRIIHKNN